MPAGSVSGQTIPRLAVTIGEPSGIGPELCVRLFQESLPAKVVLIGSRELLEDTAAGLGVSFSIDPYSPSSEASWQIHDVPTPHGVEPGKLDTAHAQSVIKTLEIAVDGCSSDEFDAMVTCPVHKGVINDAGLPFTGHTEFLAQRTNTRQVVMMLVANSLRVALVTTHLPLARVPEAITRELLDQTIRILCRDLSRRFGIRDPRLLICGLNPHAGEGGHLGREDMEIVEPAIRSLQHQGFSLTGPVPADTAFTPAKLATHDAVLAMYHDQGLPVLKYAGFGNAVNVTLGLPVIRTSVDHGTALDIAGKGQADSGSLQAAVALALDLINANRAVEARH